MKKKQCNQQLPYRILAALERGPMTAVDLGALLYRSDSQVRTAIKELLVQRLIHHSGYSVTGKRGTYPKTYALGPNGRPPKKPEPKTNAQRVKAWRSRGNDSKRAAKIRKQIEQLPQSMSLAGLLGVPK